MRYEYARVYGPDGKLLHEHPRVSAARAMRSAKFHGIRARRIDTNVFDTVCEYEPGTIIEAGPFREVWDGVAWVDAPKVGAP